MLGDNLILANDRERGTSIGFEQVDLMAGHSPVEGKPAIAVAIVERHLVRRAKLEIIEREHAGRAALEHLDAGFLAKGLTLSAHGNKVNHGRPSKAGLKLEAILAHGMRAVQRGISQCARDTTASVLPPYPSDDPPQAWPRVPRGTRPYAAAQLQRQRQRRCSARARSPRP